MQTLGTMIKAGAMAAALSALPGLAIAQDTGPQETGWSAACLTNRVCEMSTDILSNGAVAARASVYNLRGYFLLQYTVPLGIDLSQPVSVRVDEAPPIVTEVSNCSGAGCTGVLELNSELLQAMREGDALQIIFASSVNQNTFIITFSLAGFTAAFNEILG